MNLSNLADLADLLAALGVVASLVFVATQVRQNTKTVANTHWESYVDRLASNFARNLDERVADIVFRGRSSFAALSDTEKLTYSAWADEYILSASILFIYQEQSVLHTTVTNTADRRLAWFFAFPGNVEWWHHERRHPVPALVEQRIDHWLSRQGNQ